MSLNANCRWARFSLLSFFSVRGFRVFSFRTSQVLLFLNSYSSEHAAICLLQFHALAVLCVVLQSNEAMQEFVLKWSSPWALQTPCITLYFCIETWPTPLLVLQPTVVLPDRHPDFLRWWTDFLQVKIKQCGQVLSCLFSWYSARLSAQFVNARGRKTVAAKSRERGVPVTIPTSLRFSKIQIFVFLMSTKFGIWQLFKQILAEIGKVEISVFHGWSWPPWVSEMYRHCRCCGSTQANSPTTANSMNVTMLNGGGNQSVTVQLTLSANLRGNRIP